MLLLKIHGALHPSTKAAAIQVQHFEIYPQSTEEDYHYRRVGNPSARLTAQGTRVSSDIPTLFRGLIEGCICARILNLTNATISFFQQRPHNLLAVCLHTNPTSWSFASGHVLVNVRPKKLLTFLPFSLSRLEVANENSRWETKHFQSLDVIQKVNSTNRCQTLRCGFF